MHKQSINFLAALMLGGVWGIGAAAAERLPVFNLEDPQVMQKRNLDAFRKVLGGAPTMMKSPFATTQRRGSLVVDVDRRSGAVFYGNMQQLWNPQLKPQLPDQFKARDLADQFLKENGLLPELGPNISFAFSHFSETAIGDDIPGRIDKRVLDRQINYRTEIRVKSDNGKEMLLPVVGGGARFQVTVGDRGAVIGYRGGWRGVLNVQSVEEIKPQSAAFKEVTGQLQGVKIDNLRAQLAYYAAPGFEEQRALAPVWIVDGFVLVGNDRIPMRTQIVAATKFGPVLPRLAPPRPRDLKAPLPDIKNQDEQPTFNRQGFLDTLFPPAHAGVGFECGTSWIGATQGLGGSQGNKQGFVDQCRSAGWAVRFDWGDLNAFESDFRRNDDSYVDNVDLVFYTGHADQNGWVLNNPDDTSLSFGEVAGAIDLYGQNDLEWLIIAACGPLQSTHFTTGTTNAFDRWRPIFDGLHVFLGYGAVTFDNTTEGRRFMELTRAGWSVVDAWFRTAQEVQPGTNGWAAPNGPTIFVVAMYAHTGDHCARNDRLWGMGSTCADVPAGPAQRRSMLWSGT